MIKDEESSITPTLESFLTNQTNYFFILDTGSKDNTVNVVQTFLNRPNIIGHIQQEPFIDFATSRNRTLELARQHFPNAIFFIMPDAEWQLHNPESLITFCEHEKNTDTPLYLIKSHMNSTEFTTARLFRASAENKFNGVVHEVPITIASVTCPEQIYFEIKTSEYGSNKTKRRWQQDLLLLTEALNKDKNDPRTTFYLAQTY